MLSHKIKKIFFLIVIFQSSQVCCMDDSAAAAAAAPASYAARFPLHAAVKRGDCDGVQELIRAGIDVNGKDEEGKIPLQIAVNDERLFREDENYRRLTSLLFEGGADAREWLREIPSLFSIGFAHITNIRTYLAGFFSANSSMQIEESRKMTLHNLLVFKKLHLPRDIQMLILSKMPEYICSQSMLKLLLPFINNEELPFVISSCSGRWLMGSRHFRERMGGDERAAAEIASFRGQQTEPLLHMKIGSQEKTLWEVLASHAGTFDPAIVDTDVPRFLDSVHRERLERLKGYLTVVKDK